MIGLKIFVALLTLFLYNHGHFKHISEVGIKAPQQVRGFVGIEDVQLVNQTLFASSDDRSWLKLLLPSSISVTERLEQQPDGALLRINAADLQAMATGATTHLTESDHKLDLKGYTGRFHPHGIYVYELTSAEKTAAGNDNNYLLACINNRPSGRYIELFRIRDTSSKVAEHQASISHPLFRWINDVTMVSDHEFYVTNWLYNTPGTFPCLMESLQKKAVSYVVHCVFSRPDASDVQCQIVVEGLRMANGIQYLRDSNKVAVVESLNHRVGIYSRHEDGSLTIDKHLFTNSACDNLDVLSDGKLLAACHPQSLAFAAHSVLHTFAPTQVLLLDPSADDDDSMVKEVLSTKGELYSAASVATLVNNGETMVLGAVHVDGLLFVQTR
eukprot:m.105532 g.105532  ORF g.105532 m.105532 type:complete len:385 (-) comp15120_c0_seq2:174-1328(-)